MQKQLTQVQSAGLLAPLDLPRQMLKINKNPNFNYLLSKYELASAVRGYSESSVKEFLELSFAAASDGGVRKEWILTLQTFECLFESTAERRELTNIMAKTLQKLILESAFEIILSTPLSKF